jgi:4'-phosphopantetheinyl transferase
VSDAPQRRVRPQRALDVVFVDLLSSHDALDAAEAAAPRLSVDERSRASDMQERGNADAPLWRAAHIALRIAIERHAGAGVRGVAYDIEPGGRPRLPVLNALVSTPHFNLAHSGAYALIAVSHAGPVGIDLETRREITMKPDRRLRIEAVAEQLSPGQPLPLEPDARFLQAWVRLEAAAKAGGQGIGQILTDAGVVGGKGAPDRSRLISASPVRDLNVKSGCFAAVAGAGCHNMVAVEAFPTSTSEVQAFLKTAV